MHPTARLFLTVGKQRPAAAWSPTIGEPAGCVRLLWAMAQRLMLREAGNLDSLIGRRAS